MSEWKQRMEAIVAQFEDPRLGRDYVEQKALTLVNDRLDAEGLRNKVWMVMPYSCDRCGFVSWYEAEVGVEGPESWRADLTYVASPFTAGRCEMCRGSMTHAMSRDIRFSGLRDPGEPFVVPPYHGLPAVVAEKDALAQQPVPALEMTKFADRMFRVPRDPVHYVTHGCDDEGNVIYSTAVHAFLSTPMHAIRRATTEAPRPRLRYG